MSVYEDYFGSDERKFQCTASSQYSTTYRDEYAFDGNISSAWLSDNSGSQTDGSCWLQWDFEEEKLIGKMRMAARSGGAQNEFPEDIKIYCSSTGDFSGEETHLGNFTLSQPAGGGEYCDWITISVSIEKRYLRIEIHSQQRVPGQNASGSWLAVGEVQFQLSLFQGCFSGYVYEQGSPISRTLYLHRRDDGSLTDNTTSSGDGYYYLETIYSGSHYIVCLDDEVGEDYNDLIIGNVYPEEIE